MRRLSLIERINIKYEVASNTQRLRLQRFCKEEWPEVWHRTFIGKQDRELAIFENIAHKHSELPTCITFCTSRTP